MTSTEVHIRLDRVEQAVRDLAAGRAVVMMGDDSSGYEGDIVFGASIATAELMAFTVRHSSGFVCVALTQYQADRLDLPRMRARTGTFPGPEYAVSVDARHGIATGISAADRALTARLLSSPATRTDELSRPGHVVTMRTHDGGVFAAASRGEAAVELATLAGLRPAAVLCGVVSVRDNTLMAQGHELREFADKHALTLISIAELIDYTRQVAGKAPPKWRNFMHRGKSTRHRAAA
jgi:3,4-dihydroxy 2-butanone 4-phosphate synthase/GTP cyclohydrolase II